MWMRKCENAAMCIRTISGVTFGLLSWLWLFSPSPKAWFSIAPDRCRWFLSGVELLVNFSFSKARKPWNLVKKKAFLILQSPKYRSCKLKFWKDTCFFLLFGKTSKMATQPIFYSIISHTYTHVLFAQFKKFELFMENILKKRIGLLGFFSLKHENTLKLWNKTFCPSRIARRTTWHLGLNYIIAWLYFP